MFIKNYWKDGNIIFPKYHDKNTNNYRTNYNHDINSLETCNLII